MKPWMLLLTALLTLGACSFSRKDDSPIIKNLEGREIPIERGVPIEGGREKAVAAYREFLNVAPDHEQRPEAMRRLGDLQLEGAEERQLADTGEAAPKMGKKPEVPRDALNASDYRRAIKWYQDMLRAYPHHPGNDRVYYQLAKAYEQTGDLQQSLRVLDQLVAAYPQTTYRDEAQFRRGELLFTLRSYEASQQAYESILQQGNASPFYERALFMHGWSHYKQLRYEPALQSFFSVLDRKLIGRFSGNSFNELTSLSRADRELVEDTFRVVSLSLSNINGVESISGFFQSGSRRNYEFLVYQQLGDLYFKQERIKDAADTYSAFGRRYPTHPQAPLLQAKVIESFQQTGFAGLALEAKKEFAIRYGRHSDYRRVSSSEVYARVLPVLKSNLEDLARHYHASAQKTKTPGDYLEAARWYRAFLEEFPADPQAPMMNFLLAEMLFEDKRFAEAALEYEKTAYDYPRHEKSADAGYAALLAYAGQEKQLPPPAKTAWLRRITDSALRFGDANPFDARTPTVLANAAERLYALHAPERAATVARRVLEAKPEPPPALRRTAWTVVAHTDFEKGAFDRAETGYQQALALTPVKEASHGLLVERLAAAVYKQGEQSRSAGKQLEAAAHFLRVGNIAPLSPIRANAEYDAAAAYIAMKQWQAASRVLENFRKSHPGHPLQADVSHKLAVAYLEQGKWSHAALEFEALAADKNKDAQVRREALWQAAELQEKAGNDPQAQAAYERYVAQFPAPFETSIEARHRLAGLSLKRGQGMSRHRWLNELVKAEQGGGSSRTDRTRFLAATATMSLAEPHYEAFRTARLKEPLKKNLKIKKEKMQLALKAYSAAAEYGVAEVATAATFHIAEIYRDFSRDLLSSQRPKGLSAEELEQYVVMLEEQAYPFEEKSIELHEVNVRRITNRLYDQWIRRSLDALGKLRPVQYAKVEKSEVIINALR
ncbi:MAG: tetratricopeptide repeat protein [Gammaproteobacteria bacterium]|nr:tetratricopeptide repeat protein [Gammaproteobacteria bacterium]MDH3406061.1 tetratricopeptide repeat protein [Gammaproteobacteria bacterium]MDH5486165.1 tetratricopeptide repeat protein [Gammaproteobacteria bacterium]